MDFRKVLVLRGPNVWANFPVLEVWVHLGERKDISSEMMPGFNERLMRWLPTMIEHRCSIGERGGFFERLRRGTYLAHILEHVTLELQSLAGHEVGFGRARETLGDGYYKVAIEYREEAVVREALETARRLLLAAINDTPFDVAAEVAELRRLAEKVSLGPSTRAIAEAAQARGIPVRRLNEHSLLQLGYGAQARRVLAAQSDRTAAVAEEIAQDKDLTRDLLFAAGLPVPEGFPVGSVEEAWETAQYIGLPVVVKPRYGSQGRGVATGLTTREQVAAAYEAASQEFSSILVESHAEGDDYRLLVVGDRLVAAARREPPQVVGDGRQTIAQLVEHVNRDSRRGEDHATALSKIPLDAIAQGVLAQQGLTVESVPAEGQRVLLRRNANLSTGGTAADVTSLVHPEVAQCAIDAVRIVGLDISGVDVIARDISQPLNAQRGVIIEINAAPGLRMHLEPSSGVPQPVGEAIIASMFPEGKNGRIPLVAVTGANGKTTTTRLIAHIVGASGKRVGMTCTDGIYVAGRRIAQGDCSGPQSARRVLMNPQVEAAVLETARGGILREGLAFDLCDVAVVTNIADGDHLGLAGIDTPEQLAHVKAAIVDVVAPHGAAVLNAADPLAAGMAKRSKGSVVYFAIDGTLPNIVEHRAAGGRAVFVRDHYIVLADNGTAIPLMSLDRVPMTMQGKVGFQVENALAAVAAAWSLGVAVEQILKGLESFDANMDRSPGRFNLLEVRDAKLIVDYGHNAAALVALIAALEHFPSAHRTAVYSAAGDRRDEDFIKQGMLLGNAFDRVILYEDHYRRGRPAGEITALFRRGLAEGTRVSEVLEISGALQSLQKALELVSPNELVLLQADTIDETIAFMRNWLSQQTTLPAPHALASILATLAT